MTITRGLLFPSSSTKEFISEIIINPWTSLRSKESNYLEIWISLERIENTVSVEYPRLPEILA